MVMRRLFILAVSIAVILSGCYDPGQFKGGEVTDGGVFSYPRYKARLGPIPLRTVGKYTFDFSGLPGDQMWLQMYVEGHAEPDREILENLSTLIEAEIKAKDGKVICRATGRPSGTDSNRWKLMSSSTEAAYWHSNCLELTFGEKTEYKMNIRISEIDAKAPEAMLAVTLEGGGVELP